MDKQDLQKFLSGLCIASLLAGAGLTLVACEQKKGGEEEKAGTTTAPEQQQPQKPSSS